MENKVDTMICLRMGKTFEAKTPSGDFKITQWGDLKNITSSYK